MVISPFVRYVRGAGTPPSYFLDSYPGANLAFSFRQLSPTAVNCLRVRRDSDDAELDIPFLGGWVDESTLSSHCGSDLGYIVRWYDQSGNSNHLIQTTKANQPLVYELGDIVRIIDKPAMYFNGTNLYLTLTTPVSPAISWSSFQLSKRTNVVSLAPVLSSSVSDAPFTTMENGDSYYYLRSASGTFISTNADPTINRKLIASVYNGTGGHVWEGNAVIGGGNFGTTGVGNFIDYGRRETVYSNGYAQEFIFYNSDKTSDVININANMLNAVPSLPSTTREGYAIVIGGQSNGADRFVTQGNLPSGLQSEQTNSYVHFKTVDNATNNGFWSLLKSGVNSTTGSGVVGSFGIGVNINDRLKTYNKTGYLIPTAVGGTGLDNSLVPGWNSTHTGEYYDRMLTNFNQAMAQIDPGANVTPVLVWVHGELDATDATWAGNYETNLTALITKFRSDTGIANLPVIITQLRSDTIYPFRATVRTAQANVATNMTDVYLFDTSAYLISADGEHYNPITPNYVSQQGAILLGQGLADFINTNI